MLIYLLAPWRSSCANLSVLTVYSDNKGIQFNSIQLSILTITNQIYL